MKPIAIVLTSMQSSPMEITKLLGKSAEVYLADMLQSIGLDVLISKQTDWIEANTTHRFLNDTYKDQGAIAAICSFLSDNPDYSTALLVPGDMPLLDEEVIQQLLDTYEEEDTIVCFRLHGTPYIEPFPAIYEAELLALMNRDVISGKIELQELLNHAGSHLIEIPVDQRFLKASEGADKIVSVLNGKAN